MPRRSSRDQFDVRHVVEENGRAAVGFDHDIFEVPDALEVAAATDHELVFGEFEGAPADIHVGAANDVADLAEWNAKARKRFGIDHDAYCLTKPPTLATSATPFGLGEAKADIPVLQRAECRQSLVLATQRVLVDPADAGGVWAERRGHSGRQLLGGGVEIFEHARARPIDVGAVLEDDVDERHTEEENPRTTFARGTVSSAVVSG